jgi:hypothetical protein
MNLRHARLAAPAVVLLLLTAGCGSDHPEDVSAGPVMSDLAPSYDARPRADRAERAGRTEQEERRQARRRRRDAAATRDGQVRAAARRERRGRPNRTGGSGTAAVPGTAVTTGSTVRVKDPSGDLSRSVEGSPASADIVRVQLARRGDVVEVRTTFAGTVPRRQTDSRGMNVASFYDVDDNGIVDYEVWTSLADDGWGTGYLDRRREKASFGARTGIEVTVDGNTLVTRFPFERIAAAKVFRWSAASEWGSYQSMSTSTSARDYAPDRGSVDYPR